MQRVLSRHQKDFQRFPAAQEARCGGTLQVDPQGTGGVEKAPAGGASEEMVYRCLDPGSVSTG